MLTVLEGPVGMGKTTLMIDLMARLSHGRSMPFEPLADGEKYMSLFVGPEDPFDSVVIPRLRAAGADLDYVRHYKGMLDLLGKKKRFFLDPAHLIELEKCILDNGAKLVFCDAIMSLLPSKVDSNSDSSTRSILEPLAQLADRCNVALVIGRHWAKGGASRAAAEKGLGSIAFSGVSRSVLQCAMHPAESGLRVFAVGKGSLADPQLPPLGNSLTEIETHGKKGMKKTTKVLWLSQLGGFDVDTLGRTEISKSPALGAAISWISDRLADVGEIKSRTLEVEATAAGFGKTTIEAAKTRLRVEGKIRYQLLGKEYYTIATKPPTVDEVFPARKTAPCTLVPTLPKSLFFSGSEEK